MTSIFCGAKSSQRYFSDTWEQLRLCMVLQVALLKVRFKKDRHMNGIIYLVGLVVIVLAVLSLIGLR